MNPTHQFFKKYKDYDIFIRSAGFEPIPIAFGKVISFLVRNDAIGTSVFAFAYSGMEAMQDPNINENDLLNKALGIIENYIDQNRIVSNQENTFEYKNGEFHEVNNPGWWNKMSA